MPLDPINWQLNSLMERMLKELFSKIKIPDLSDSEFTELNPLFWTFTGSFLAATVVSITIGEITWESMRLERSKPGSSERQINLVINSQSLSKEELEMILDRNIFNSEGDVGDEDKLDPADIRDQAVGQLVKSDLPLKLLGTIYGGKPDAGIALIENSSLSSINSFMVGDSLMRGATVTAILRERVIFERDGRSEYIEIPPKEVIRTRRGKSNAPRATAGQSRGPSPIANTPPPDNYKEEGFDRKGGDIKLTESYRNNLINNELTKVLQDAKAVPNEIGGEINGFKLTRIRQNSIYEKAGLQNGDVILEVNGSPLNHPGRAIQLLQSLRGAKDIEIRFKRDDAVRYLNLEIR